MIDTLLLPFQLSFMQSAFVLVTLISIPMGLLSCYVVLKGWALLGDAVSHAVLPGIVAAYVLGLPLILGAFVAGLSCAVLSGRLATVSQLKQDTAIGVVFTGFFAIGLVAYQQVPTTLHLDHILYGDLLGVNPEDLWLVFAISGGVFLFLVARPKDLVLWSFDPIQAQVLGLPVRFYHYGLLTALSLMAVATLSAAGLILSIGLLITPGAIGYLLARRFKYMQLISVAVCLSANIGGVYASFFLNSAPAPTIILVLAGGFVVAAFLFVARQILAQRNLVAKS